MSEKPEEEFEFQVTEEQEQPWLEFEGPDFYVDLIGDSIVAEDSKLTAAKRKGLSSSSFADPENRAYPVMDASHARAALQRFMQFGKAKYKGAKRASVARRILSACKRFSIKVSDGVRKRLSGDSVQETNDLQVQYRGFSTREIVRRRATMREKLGEDADSELEFEVSKAELERRRSAAHP